MSPSDLAPSPGPSFLCSEASKNGAVIEALRDFFIVELQNPHTRKTYWNEIRHFAEWCQGQQLSIERVSPRDMSAYAEQDKRRTRTVNTGLSAIRTLLDFLVERGLIPINPATRVKNRRQTIDEGATPTLTLQQIAMLMDSIPKHKLIDLRDRAIIGTLHYTLCRSGALILLDRGDYFPHGHQRLLRLREKRGHVFNAPVPPELARILGEYLDAALIPYESDALFQSCKKGGKFLTGQRLQAPNLSEMITRRAHAAGLHGSITPHVFRATSITAFLDSGGRLEEAQQLARHKHIWTTQIYDRRKLKRAYGEMWRLSLESGKGDG